MRRSLVILAFAGSVLPALAGDDSPKASGATSSEAGRHDRVMSDARMAPDDRTDDMLERVDAIRIGINAVTKGAIASTAPACRRAIPDRMMSNATDSICPYGGETTFAARPRSWIG